MKTESKWLRYNVKMEENDYKEEENDYKEEEKDHNETL